MPAHFSLAWIASWLLLPFTLLGQPFQTKKSESDPTQRYLVLATRRTSTLQKEISVAAAAGYRVVAGWEEGELVVLLEKVTEQPAIYQYRLVATNTTSTLEKELREAGAAGFRVVPEAMFSNTIRGRFNAFIAESVVVMEKAPNSADTYEYRVVFLYDRGTFLHGVLEGYPFSGRVGRVRDSFVKFWDEECECTRTRIGEGSGAFVLERILVAEKPKAAPSLPPGGESRPDVLQRYLVLNSSPAALEEQLAEAAEKGYCRLHTAEISLLERRPEQRRWEIVVILEKASQEPGVCQYLLVPTLQPRRSGPIPYVHELQAAGGQGFRPHPTGIFEIIDTRAVIMEKASDGAVAFRYLLLGDLDPSALQKRLAEASAQGYRVVSANGYAVILGKPTETPDKPATAGTESPKAGDRETILPGQAIPDAKTVGTIDSLVIEGNTAETRVEPAIDGIEPPKAGDMETNASRQTIPTAKTVAVLGAWGEHEMPGTFGKIVTILGAMSGGEGGSHEADPATAKRKVESGIGKWGRYIVLDDPAKADLVLVVVVRRSRKFGPETRSNELLVFPGGAIPDESSVALWQSGDTKGWWGYAADKATKKFQKYVQELEKKGHD